MTNNFKLLDDDKTHIMVDIETLDTKDTTVDDAEYQVNVLCELIGSLISEI